MAGVVEAQSIYDSLVAPQPEDARARIAELCAWRYGADLGEAAAEAKHGVRDARVLVEASRNADRVRQRQAGKARCEARMIRWGARKKPELQGFKRCLVRLLRR